MDINEKIKKAYAGAKNYPDLVQRLIDIKVKSYTVDVYSGTILYRFGKGVHVIQTGSGSGEIASVFNNEQTIQAVKDTQAGKTAYPAFMDDIARAGVRFYEATLNGDNKRVTYMGAGGYYEEAIPV